MKTIDELIAELPEGTEDQGGWLREQMVAGLNRNPGRMRPEILQQAMFNWSLQLYEAVIRLLVDDEQVDQALAGFRQFAQHSHLVTQYNALLASMKQSPLVVASAVPPKSGDPNRRKKRP